MSVLLALFAHALATLGTLLGPGGVIGLAIVQVGVERMGGRVGVESTPGQGSRFWFELRKAEKRV